MHDKKFTLLNTHTRNNIHANLFNVAIEKAAKMSLSNDVFIDLARQMFVFVVTRDCSSNNQLTVACFNIEIIFLNRKRKLSFQ